MRPDDNLPREVNPTRIVSQYRRTVRLVRKASADAKGNPNPGTVSRRRERTLAAWSLSRKVRFVRITAKDSAGTFLFRPTFKGAARLGSIRKAARDYRKANAAWRAYYFGAHTLGGR